MGCAGSKYFSVEPNLHVANGSCVFGIGEITAARTGYVLKAEAFGHKANTPWTAYFVREGAGKTLDVRDHTGRVVYQIKPHGAPPVSNQNVNDNTITRNKMHIVKADTSSKVAVLKRMFYVSASGQLQSDGTFVLYSYSPNFEGQSSTDADKDGEALYPFASLPDPPIRAPPKNGFYDISLFAKSNEVEDATIALQYKILEKMPFRMFVRKAESAAEPTGGVAEPSTYDMSVVATVANDPYLTKISGGEYFKWNREFDKKGRRDTEWGVDCAAGVDSLLVIAAAMTGGPNGMPNAAGVVSVPTAFMSASF